MRNPRRFRKPKKNTLWTRFVSALDRAERHPVARAAAIAFATASGVVLGLTFWQISVDYEDRLEERQARKEERIERAWARLHNKGGGDTGLGADINALLRSGIDTRPVDLSCKTSGEYDEEKMKCITRPMYSGIAYNGADSMRRGVPNDASFDFKNVTDATFSGDLDHVIFTGSSTMDGAAFLYASLVGTWWGDMDEDYTVSILFSDLSFSYIENPGKFELSYSNVSGAVFQDTNVGTPSPVNYNWAWADYPPRRLGKETLDAFPDFTNLVLCDPKYRLRGGVRDARRAAYPIILKEDATGSAPRQRDIPAADYNSDRRVCVEMTPKEAQIRYPNAYKPISTVDF